MRHRPPVLAGILTAVGLLVATEPALAHVDYVTDPVDGSMDPATFARSVLADPVNLALFTGIAIFGTITLGAYLSARPTIPDLEVLRSKLGAYEDLLPWMLRLTVGLPLVGAGFQGYLFSPAIRFDPAANPLVRAGLIGMGFFVLFGLATRVVAAAGLGVYLWVLANDSTALLALEYVPGFLGLLVLGGGRPSADDVLQAVASAEGTIYGRIDPVHRFDKWLDETADPLRQYVPTVLRVGLGASFVYLGVVEKFGDPAQGLAVVEKYSLTSVIPVDPGMWVLGAATLEILVGLALVLGLLTRAAAGTAFLVFTLTLFGLPDDPVLAHVTMFGMASAVFTLGAGPFALDNYLSTPAPDRTSAVPADD